MTAAIIPSVLRNSVFGSMASPPSAGLSLYVGGQPGVGNHSPVNSADWSGMLASNFAGNTSPRVGPGTGLGTGSGPGSAGALDGLTQSLSALNMTGGISPSPGGDQSPMSLSSEHNAVFFNSAGANLAGLTPGAAVAAAFSSGGNTGSSANSASGVQTLYGSNDPAQAMLAVRLQQAQQAAAANSTALLQAQQNSLLGGLQGLANSARTSAEMNAVYGAAPQQLSSSLYIKNLPPDADKLFLYERFSPYGAILSVKILFDPQTGQCRGVGFVNYSEHASAVRAIQALHGTKLGDKLLHVSLQTPRIRAT